MEVICKRCKTTIDWDLKSTMEYNSCPEEIEVAPCQVCMTREFNEGRGFAQSMIESDLDRVPHGC